MVENQMNAILVRVCSHELKNDLGKSIIELYPKLLKLHDQNLLHCCGEGGEFESFVVDCPIFKQKIIVEKKELVEEENKPFHFVGRINFLKLNLKFK